MASQTITGPELQFTQDNKRCYAFSGDIPAGTSLSTRLEYTTGSGYIVGELQFNGYVDDNNITTGQIGAATLSFNNIVIATLKNDTVSEDMPTQVTQKLVIPPFTAVKVQCIASGDDANSQASLVFTGRVYEHLEVRN